MLSDSDKQILSRLKNEDPEAYDFLSAAKPNTKSFSKRAATIYAI